MAAILEQLASATGQTKQDLNIALARKIAAGNDVSAVQELVAGLQHNTKAIRHDCIKTLYETGTIQPQLISPYTEVLLSLLDDKDNRMQWGAMTALSAVAAAVPDQIYHGLHKIIAVANAGSVITKDHTVRILAILATQDTYRETALPLLLEQLLQFKKILLTRIDDTEQESKRKRLEKVLKKLTTTRSR